MTRHGIPADDRLDPSGVRGAADGLRSILAALDEPGSDLGATAATRHRIEGAAAALETLLGEQGPQA